MASYYHIYNRGVDKRDIFVDNQDYLTFLLILKNYLTSPSLLQAEQARSHFKPDKPSRQQHRRDMNLFTSVDMLAFCLMPNHYHLLVREKMPGGVTKLMRRLGTYYSMYFNKKYGRRGVLFESRYQAVAVESDEQLLQLAAFIHLNPGIKSVKRFGLVETVTRSDPEEYEFSSYGAYLDTRAVDWLETNTLQALLQGGSILDYTSHFRSGDWKKIRSIAIDSEKP